MPRKLPPYFLKADYDSPCDKCKKVRSTCRFCEKCYDCCECSPQFICPHCHGYDISVRNSDMAKELESCDCESCFSCHKNIKRDSASFLEGKYEPYCESCFEKLNDTN